MDENMLPNEGSYFQSTEPEDQKRKRAETRSKTQTARGVIEESIKRFEKKIDFYGRVDSIQVDITADPGTFQKVHAANTLTRNNLRQEKAWLEAVLKTL